MDVIARIVELMEAKGWTKYRLAKKSGISQSTIANIFRRNSVPDVSTIEMLCDGFEISLAQFFAEGELIVMDADQRETFVNWRFLTDRQKAIVCELINSYQADKHI